jgi:hypothetical protein
MVQVFSNIGVTGWRFSAETSQQNMDQKMVAAVGSGLNHEKISNNCLQTSNVCTCWAVPFTHLW